MDSILPERKADFPLKRASFMHFSLKPDYNGAFCSSVCCKAQQNVITIMQHALSVRRMQTTAKRTCDYNAAANFDAFFCCVSPQNAKVSTMMRFAAAARRCGSFFNSSAEEFLVRSPQKRYCKSNYNAAFSRIAQIKDDKII